MSYQISFMRGQNKNKKEFGQVYDDNVDKIYRFIYIKVNSKEIAEDLTSETFLKTRKAFKVNKIDNPKAYSYKTARNLVIDHYRTKKEKALPIEDVQLADTTDIEKQAIVKSDIQYVLKGLSSIRTDYQDLIIWYYLDELTVPEIATLVNRSENATRVMIHRATNSLKKVLEV